MTNKQITIFWLIAFLISLFMMFIAFADSAVEQPNDKILVCGPVSELMKQWMSDPWKYQCHKF